MTRQFLQILLGVVILISSTPRVMAQEAVSEDVRADFFAVGGSEDKADKSAAVLFDDFALLPIEELETESEETVESEEEAKREQKRTASNQIFINKCRISNFLSLKQHAKGVARHPQSQDAQQERTAMVRFLQISALDC